MDEADRQYSSVRLPNLPRPVRPLLGHLSAVVSFIATDFIRHSLHVPGAPCLTEQCSHTCLCLHLNRFYPEQTHECVSVCVWIRLVGGECQVEIKSRLTHALTHRLHFTIEHRDNLWTRRNHNKMPSNRGQRAAKEKHRTNEAKINKQVSSDARADENKNERTLQLLLSHSVAGIVSVGDKINCES